MPFKRSDYNISPDIARIAMLGLLRNGDFLKKLDTSRYSGVPFLKHPFDLEIPGERNNSFYHRRIEFLGSPGHTDESIEHLEVNLGWSLGNNITHLRIIYAQCDIKNTDQHDVYFEIGLSSRIFIIGGCTDFSGTGGSGKEHMERLFTLISFVYEVKIDQVEIEYIKSIRIRSAISKSMYLYHKDKSNYDFTAI